MTSTDLARIVIKGLAIFLIAQGLIQIPNLVISLQYSEPPSNQGYQFQTLLTMITFTPLIAGIVLWFFADKLAGIIVGDVEPSPTDSATANEIQAVAMSSIGLLILVLSIPRMVSLVIQLSANTGSMDSTGNLFVVLSAELASEIIKFILAVSLILGISGWLKLLRRLRGAGLQ